MRIKVLAVTGAVLIWPICAALALPLSTFNQLIVFGDSLSDAGNASIATSGAFPGPNYATRNVVGVPFPVGYYTDGPATTPGTASPTGLWIDQLAAQMGLTDPQPFLAPAGGTNYAVASAQTGVANPQDMGNLVATFLASHPTAPSSALYTFWGGANDLYNGGNAKHAADNIEGEIAALASKGAKYFLWLNLPPLGNTPRGSSTAASLNAASNAFNAEWATDLGLLGALGINVIPVDINALFGQISANPGSFGFTDITDPAQGNAAANPNQFVFWDIQHPTTQGDLFVAQLARADVLAAPEPTSIGLVSVPLFIAFLYYWPSRTRKHKNEFRAGITARLRA